MRCKAIILACMILASGLFMGTAAQAQPYSGTIVFKDGTSHIQDYFEPTDTVMFDVTVLDNGVPLQSQTINVVIVGDGVIGEVFNHDYITDAYGQFSGDNWDDGWTTLAVGLYTMFVNYTGNQVVSDTFRIYDAVPWSATGWTLRNNVVTDTFIEDQQVTLLVVVSDQYGNPFDGSYGDVSYEMTRGVTYISSSGFATNISGEYQWTFNTWSQNQNQFGRYLVTIFNDATPPQAIGFFNFTVALPNLATIQLSYYGDNRTVFREGEWVGYTIMLYYQTTLPYDSDTYAARVLLFKEGETNPLENNTLTTDNEGEDYDSNFYSIGYGESVKGQYYVRVYNQTWYVIGTATFLVIDIDIGILPEKAVYSQGDAVTLTVSTSLEEAYRVQIADNTGTTVPSASWNVAAGTNEWWRDYTFPDIPDGNYRVDVYMDTLLLSSRYFELKKITLDVMLSQTAFVPGQSGTAFWRAVNNHDGGAISVTGDSIMHYVDDTWNTINKDLSAISGSSGSFSFTVPAGAMEMTTGDIDIDAHDSAGHYDSGTVGFQVRTLWVDVDMDKNEYLPSDTMFLTLSSLVSSTNFPVPNVDIKLTVQRDGTMVGSSWTVRTNSAGTVSTTYQLPATATKGIWVLVINATFDANNDIKYNGTRDFTLVTDPIVSLALEQVKSLYAPGAQVTVPYRVLRNGTEVTAEVTFEAYITQLDAPIAVALGFGNGGVISFTLPNNFEGTLTVEATATTSDGFQASDTLSNILVSSGQLVLFSVKSIYLPGENVTWTYVLSGDTQASAQYKITAPDGVLLAQGAPENATIRFQLPTEHAVNPTVRVYVTGTADTYFATATAQVYQGYVLEYRILSNSYSPGDVMEVNYTISKVGDVPDNVNGFQIQINIVGEHTETYWVTEVFGVLSYNISADIEDGKHIVSATLVGSTTLTDIQTVIIDSNAGELAHGTILGMNASAFIVLIIALIALIIAIFGVVKWRGMAKADAQPAEPEPPEQPVESYQPPPETFQGTAPAPPPPPGYAPPQPPQQ